VADHHVRDETRLFQVQRHAGHGLGVQHAAFDFLQVMVHALGHRPGCLVDDFAHAGQGRILPLCDEHDLIAGNGAQMTGEMQVLAGKVLVDEENFHMRSEGAMKSYPVEIERRQGDAELGASFRRITLV
jgi:hypothetical protein